MRMILFILSFICSFSAMAVDRSLNQKITHVEELQRMVQAQCLNSPSSSNVKVIIQGKTYTCPQLIVITDRLADQVDREVKELETCQANQERTPANTLATQATEIASRAVACPQQPSDMVCLGQFACAAATVSNPLLAMVAGGFTKKSACGRNVAGDVGNCLKSVLKGIFDSLWGLLSLVWDVGKAAARKAGEWLGIIRQHERSSSEKLMAAQQAGPGLIRQFWNDKAGTIRKMISSMYNGIKDAAMQSYGCEQWSGAPFVSRCIRPMTNWKCASCTQKMQMMCGIAGFAVGEIGTALLTGGLAAGGKAVALAAVKGVRIAARGSKVSRMAVTAIRAVPKSQEIIQGTARAARAAAQVTGRVLTATEKKAVQAWNAVERTGGPRKIAAAADKLSKSVVGDAARIALRPAAVYLDALEKATELGFRSVDGAIARASGAVRATENVADVAAASRVEVTTTNAGDEINVASDTVRAATETRVTAVSAVDEIPAPSPSVVETRTSASGIPITRVSDDVPTPSIVVQSTPETVVRVADDVPTPALRTADSSQSLTIQNIPEPRVSASGIPITRNNPTRLADDIPSPAPRVSTSGVPITRRTPATAEVRTVVDDSAQSLRSIGLEPDTIVNPYPARGSDRALETSQAQRAREIEWTKVDLDGKFAKWKQDGVYDDIFATLGTLRSEQEKKRYLAILLNAPESSVAETLARLKSFKNISTDSLRVDFFKKLDTKIAGVSNELEATAKLPASVERTEKMAALARQRSALLQERTLLDAGDNFEITNIFSARASNQNYIDKNYSPHSLDGSFSVDIKIKNRADVCRGSYAGAGSAASNLTGNFLTICRETGYNDRSNLQRNLAAPGDRTREGKATFGYERFNRFELRKGDEITLGLNGPVTYTDEGMLGTGGLGGGVELFTYRSPRNPIDLDRLQSSVRVPSCSRADCDKLFDIQERIRPSNLANQSSPDRFLDQAARETNGALREMQPRIDNYVNSLSQAPDPNLTRFREEFSEVRTAFGIKREIELKRGIRPGALDAETQALRNNTRIAESLGDDVAARITAQNVTDPAQIQRMYREAIEGSPLATAHADNVRFIEDGMARLRSGKLSPSEKNDLLYQLSVRAGQEEDLALAFKTLDYKAGKSVDRVAGLADDQRRAVRSAVQNNIRDVQQNGLARAPQLDPRVTPELRRVAGLSDRQRLAEANKVLNDPALSRAKQNAILESHEVGRGTGRGYFEYSLSEIREKTRILRDAGFTKAQTRALMESGVTGSTGSRNILDDLYNEAAKTNFDFTPPVRPAQAPVETTQLVLPRQTPPTPTTPAPSSNIWEEASNRAIAEQKQREAVELWGRVADEYKQTPAPSTVTTPTLETPVIRRVDTPAPTPTPEVRAPANTTLEVRPNTPAPRVTETPAPRPQRVVETPSPAPSPTTQRTPPRTSPEAPAEYRPLSAEEVKRGPPIDTNPESFEPRAVRPVEYVPQDMNKVTLELNSTYTKMDDGQLLFRARNLENERLAARQRIIDEFDNTKWNKRYYQMQEENRAGNVWHMNKDFALEKARITRVPEADKVRFMDDTMRARLSEVDVRYAKEKEIFEAERARRSTAAADARANVAPKSDEQIRQDALSRENWVVQPEERDILSSRRMQDGRINTNGVQTESQLMENARLQVARSSGVPENRAGYISYKPKYSPKDAEDTFGRLFSGQRNPPNIRRAHSVLTMEPATAQRMLSENMPDVQALYNRLKTATPDELQGISPQMKKYYEDRLGVYVCYQTPAACRTPARLPANIEARITPEMRRIGAITDNNLRLKEAERVLGRTLTDAEKVAVIEAHNVALGTGRGFYTYTDKEILAKGLKLRGPRTFTPDEMRKLMESGVTGSAPSGTSLLDNAIENTDFNNLLRQPAKPAAPARTLAQLEDAAQTSARQYENLRTTSRDPAAIYEARLQRDQDALTASYAREDANRVTAAAQAEADAKLFQQVLNQPVQPRQPASVAAVTERAPNPIREQMTPEKLAQIEAAYGGNQLDTILNMPEAGGRVAYRGTGDTVRDGKLAGVDPEKPGNFIVVTTDAKGVESRVSMAQTSVATTPAEIRLLSEAPEVQAANRKLFEEVLANSGKRAPARQPTAAEIKAAEDKRINDMIVQVATGNPKQKEIDALSREMQSMSILDPKYEPTLKRIRELEKPYSPVLDPEEAKAFAIIAEIPDDVVKFSPQEWRAIQEANRIRKTRVSTVDTPEFRRAFALAEEQEVRLNGIIKRMDLEYDKAYPRKFGQSTAEVPANVITELQAIPKAKDVLASAQKLFKVRPSSAGLEEVSSDFYKVRGFFFTPANKELIESSESLKYVRERFRRYQKSMDANAELGSRTPGIP